MRLVVPPNTFCDVCDCTSKEENVVAIPVLMSTSYAYRTDRPTVVEEEFQFCEKCLRKALDLFGRNEQ